MNIKLIKDLGMVYPTETSKQKKRKWLVECPKCFKPFETYPNNIKSGQTSQCIKCGNIAGSSKLKSTTAEFIKKSIKLYGNKYDYTNVEYINNYTKVKILCKLHGVFLQTPNDHLGGHSCSLCAEYGGGFKTGLPGILYYVTINNGEAYKIGITNKSVKERFQQDFHKITILAEVHYLSGRDALDKELEILKEFKKYKYTGTPLLLNGNTEVFSIDIFNLYKGIK